MMFARTLSFSIGERLCKQWTPFLHDPFELDSFHGMASIGTPRCIFLLLICREFLSLVIDLFLFVVVMTRSIEAVGVRFRLLNCVLSMIQDDSLSIRVSKNVIRERIYAAALDYFTYALNLIQKSSGFMLCFLPFCSILMYFDKNSRKARRFFSQIRLLV